VADQLTNMLVVKQKNQELEAWLHSDNLTQFTIIEKNNFQEVLQKILQYKDNFAVVLIDSTSIGLEVGISVTQLISFSNRLKHVTTILLVDSDIPEKNFKIINSGAHYYLPKNLLASMGVFILKKVLLNRVSLETQSLQAASFMQEAHFSFRLLQEGTILAAFIAAACPNPRLCIVGISEIFINAIEHGNLAISYEDKSKLHSQDGWLQEIERRLNLPEHCHKKVEVRVIRSSTTLIIEVTDQGKGFDWRKYQNFDARRILDSHGRGIAMAKNLAFEKLVYNNSGNRVRCSIPLSNPL